jgi:hypothetical protein
VALTVGGLCFIISAKPMVSICTVWGAGTQRWSLNPTLMSMDHCAGILSRAKWGEFTGACSCDRAGIP